MKRFCILIKNLDLEKPKAVKLNLKKGKTSFESHSWLRLCIHLKGKVISWQITVITFKLLLEDQRNFVFKLCKLRFVLFNMKSMSSNI